MKMKRTLKRLAAALMLAAGILAVSATSAADEIVQVFGSKNQLLGTYPATSVGTIAFAEAPDSIVIPLTDDVKFTMIKVEGGVDYALRNGSLTWTEGRTKPIQDFWIGKFEVTQAVWKEVMGSETDFTTGTYKQSAVGDSYPIANITYEEITADETGFLSKLNARIDELKASNPALETILGERKFRLPSEWEWEYAASGGKDYASLKYYFSGTSGRTLEDLQEVAINSLEPNKSESVAVVGSKKPNILGLYDMSGNVWEWVSDLGYPGHEETPGYLKLEGVWEDDYRGARGGGWTGSSSYNVNYFLCVGRYCFEIKSRQSYFGFRLAL